MARELSFSLGIGATPLYDQPDAPDLAAELFRIYQAINTTAFQLDAASNSIAAPIADRAYILASTASKEVNISRIYGQASVDLVAGEVVHFGSNYSLSKAQSNGTHNLKAQGIALTTGLAGTWIPVALRGVCRLFVGLSAGTDYYLSMTAGNISALLPTAGNTVQYVGFALSGSELYFSPEVRHSVA
jgi:hypothetical protein